jgi:peptidyl-prolyl cis-trans isomerase C
MSRSLKYLHVGILVSVVFLNCNNDKIVARVGNKTIKSKELKDSFLSEKMSREKLEYQPLREHLDKLIEDKLKLFAAYEEKLDEDPEILAQVKEFEKRDVYNKVIENEVIDKVLTDKYLRERYLRTTKEVKCQQIFLKSPMADSARRSESKKKMQEIRRKILKGASFDEMARQFSQDSLTAGKGGDLGFLKWGDRNFNKKFYETLFSLEEGQVSDIVESRTGIHLLKAVKIRPIDQPPYKEMKTTLQRQYFDDNRSELEKLYRRMTQELREKYAGQFINENIELFVDKLNWAREDSEKVALQETPNNFDQLTEADQQKPLISFKGGQYTIGDFVKEINENLPERQPKFDSTSVVLRYLQRPMNLALINQFGYDQGLNRSKSIKEDDKKRLETLMIQKAEKLNVTEKVNPTDEDYKNYFAQHQDKYIKPTEAQVQEIFVKSENLANEIAERARKESFDALEKKYNERTTSHKNNGLLGYISRTRYGNIGKQAVDMKVGQIAGPIKNANGFSIIKVLDKREERPRTFEESIVRVKSDYSKEKRNEVKEQWLESLRSKYVVQTFEANIKKMSKSDMTTS